MATVTSPLRVPDVKAPGWAPTTLVCAAARPDHGLMTQWSTYTPYDISYTLTDADPVESTRMRAARVVSWLIVGTTAVLVVGHLALALVSGVFSVLTFGF